MRKGRLTGLCMAVVVMAAVVPAWAAYDVPPASSTDGTPVPDKDKQGIIQGQPVPAVPPPPQPDDMGCWAATAANVLGAAGWGVGANAQAKADSIYTDLINRFKVNPGDQYLKATGDCSAAAKWWVHNIGLNALKAGYDPNNPYINFGIVERTLNEFDYDYLLDELKRCQYIGVRFMILGQDAGHGMTLVGGNYGPHGPVQPPNAQQSVWHNSDNEGQNTNDEVFGNRWMPGPPNGNFEWRLVVNPLPHDPALDWWADGYFKACKGQMKPASAIGNYDVHSYIGIGPLAPEEAGKPRAYTTSVQTISTGAMYGIYTGPGGLHDPCWEPRPATEPQTLFVPNQQQPDPWYKVLDLSIDFRVDENPENTNVFNILVYDDQGNQIPLDHWAWASEEDGNLDYGQILLTYVFPNQPNWEKIIFPTNDYKTLTGNVFEWNLATECLPEPATLLLVGLGALAALRRRTR